MKILIIDDSKNHQESADQTLGEDRELVVVSSHEQALEVLTAYIKRRKVIKSEQAAHESEQAAHEIRLRSRLYEHEPVKAEELERQFERELNEDERLMVERVRGLPYGDEGKLIWEKKIKIINAECRWNFMEFTYQMFLSKIGFSGMVSITDKRHISF